MRNLPDPSFAGDDGTADPAVTSALERYARERQAAPVLVALASSRLLVPVVAMLGESDTEGPRPARDKSADIAAVLMQGRDGRTALLAFTCLDALRQWDGQARPVPVSTFDAARSAAAEGASALLVDVAGPVMFVVETDAMERLAAGQQPVRTSAGYAWLAGGTDDST